jgi:ankyrin repeat protein
MKNKEQDSIIKAAEDGHLDMVKLLIEDGAEIDVESYYKETALMCASENGHFDIVSLLIEKGATIDKKSNYGETAIMCAARKGHFDIVGLLIKNGAKINEKDNCKKTALMRASENGYFDIVRLLIEKGAKINEKDSCKRTALMYASTKGYPDIVTLLIEKGAKIDEKNDCGQTALMYASEEGHLNIVRLLIKNGAKVNEQNNRGETAFMKAAIMSKFDIIIELIKDENDVKTIYRYLDMSLILAAHDDPEKSAAKIALLMVCCKAVPDNIKENLSPLALSWLTECKFNAFLLGTHKRIGNDSSVRLLYLDVLELICKALTSSNDPESEKDYSKLNELTAIDMIKNPSTSIKSATASTAESWISFIMNRAQRLKCFFTNSLSYHNCN